MPTLVMKFGGNSLGTAAALERVLRVIVGESRNQRRLVVVVSALDGVTDMLLEAARQARIANQRSYRRIAANLRSRHLALSEQLSLDRPDWQSLQADIDQLISDLLDNCAAIAKPVHDELSPRDSDAIVAVGERLSARIIAALLRQQGVRAAAVDGTDLIVTDDVFGNADPEAAATARKVERVLRPMLQREIVPVVTGFIGATAAGETTTLGRGGTDYTASVLSAVLGAGELWIWTDVEGMMSGDPRQLPEARNIARLSYEEAADLAYFGAKLLHARMIAPLAPERLPLRIKNINRPGGDGTLVGGGSDGGAPAVKAVTAIEGLALRRPASGSLSGVTRLIGTSLLKTLGMQTEVMIASQSSGSSFICVVIPTSIGAEGVERLRRALQAKMSEYPEKMPWTIEIVALVTVIGSDLQAAPGLIGEMFSCLGELELYGVALGAAHCSVTFALPLRLRRAALERLHGLIIRSDSDSG